MVGTCSVKKKTIDLEPVKKVPNVPAPSSLKKADQQEQDNEAEKFFSTFRKSFSRSDNQEHVDESDFGEPPCSTPIDIGWNPEFKAADEDVSFSAAEDDDIKTNEKAIPQFEPSSSAGGDAAPKNEADSCALQENGEEQRRLLVMQIRKENLTLAATLEKAQEWKWSEGRLSLTFGFEYESALAKNEAGTIRKAAAQVGIAPFKMDVNTAGGREAGGEESPRVELVRRVFRGQVMKG